MVNKPALFFTSFLIFFISFTLSFQPIQTKAQTSSPQWQDATNPQTIYRPYPILEITLSYTATRDPNLLVTDMARKQGFAPRVRPQEDSYTLTLLDSNNNTLSQAPFTIPLIIQAVPPENIDTYPLESIRDELDFSVTVALPSSASVLRIEDSDGKQIIEQTVTHVPEIATKPLYRSLQAESLLPAEKNPSVKAAATQIDTLDITFVSDSYTNLNTFHADVNRFASYLLTYVPFSTYANKIVFHTVNNQTDLACTYEGRLLSCYEPKVVDVVNNAGAPYDFIVVIVNSPDVYGGSAGRIPAVYNGIEGPKVFVHEFGHTFGNLHDEYNNFTTNGRFDGRTQANCFAGNPPSPIWGQRVALSAYHLGCTYPNWYRSSEESIMFTLSAEYFNRISQDLIREQLDWYTMPISPTPTPSRTPTPSLRPTTTRTPTSTRTPTPLPNTAKVHLTLFLHGLGRAGDNVNPTGGNQSPRRMQRPFTLTLLDIEKKTLQEVSGTLQYNQQTGNFQAAISFVNSPQNPVFLAVKTQGYLSQETATPIALVRGATTSIDPFFLTVGDINSNDTIDIFDYNILIGCFSSLLPPQACTSTNFLASDLNSDGLVNEFDYNLFLRELSIQNE